MEKSDGTGNQVYEIEVLVLEKRVSFFHETRAIISPSNGLIGEHPSKNQLAHLA